MDNAIYIAVISASSAIVGGLVPSLMSYFSKKAEFKNSLFLIDKQYENNQKGINIELKRKEYTTFMDVIQEFMNNTTNPNFTKFQISVNRVLLYANNNTASLINNYYQSMIRGVATGVFLEKEKHEEYQCEIVNAMRSDIGIANSKIDNVYFVSFTPPQHP
jgi:hypothetical protein